MLAGVSGAKCTGEGRCLLPMTCMVSIQQQASLVHSADTVGLQRQSFADKSR